MPSNDIEQRVTALERAVADLEKRLAANGAHTSDPRTMDPKKQSPWWIEGAGRFKDDPEFDEIVRLGREYRESTRPGPKRKEKSAKSGKSKPKP